jgi:glycosyltransferase involved in cell wall biosynthesis
MLHEVAKRADDFDILHFHVDLLHFPMFERMANRTVTTLHGRLDLKDLSGVYDRWPEFPLVSISHNQRKALPNANWAATVHHGLPSDLLAPAARTDKPRDYLAFLGRISPEKRPDRAIEIAKRTGIKLRIAAKVDGVDEAYFRDQIAPLMKDAPVEFVGEISDQQKPEFLSGAMAVLFPIDWPEPFGLVMIEAMACGTPVIAWPCGSVREVIDDGVTGILVNSIDEAVAAVADARTLSRAKIRHVFERRFSAEVMARSYLHLYDRLLHQTHEPRAALKTA